MNGQAIIHVQLNPILVFAGTTLLVVLFTLKKSLGKARTNRDDNSQEMGWKVPIVDSHSAGDSFFHTWDVRFKSVALFSYCLCIAFLSTPFSAGIAFLFSVLVLFAGHLSLARALKRLTAMLPFLSMFLIIVPLTAVHHPGDTLFFVDPIPWPFNLRGLVLALTIALKASAIALLMEPLFNTAPLSVTINGLQRLGVPSQVCQMLLMAHRYIFVLVHEAKRMSMGMRVRGFRKRTDLETVRVMGTFVGMLMVRTIDRTDRVYQAMLSRGYQGTFPTYQEYKSTRLDWYKAAVWIVLGLSFLIIDRSGVL